MSKPKYNTRAKPDNSHDLHNRYKILFDYGWNEMEILRDIRKKDKKKEPFLVLHRTIKNPIKMTGNNYQICRKSTLAVNLPNYGNPADGLSKGLEPLSPLGGESDYGVPRVCFAPQGETHSPNDKQNENSDTINKSVNLAKLKSFSDIQSVKLMRTDKESFNIGFDSEYRYDISLQRYIISWQFAFVNPATPDDVEQLIVFSLRSKKTLSLQMIIEFIIEEWNIGLYYDLKSVDGISERRLRQWTVPVYDEKNLFVGKTFDNFREAVEACDNPDYKAKMLSCGENYKCSKTWVSIANGGGYEQFVKSVAGFGIGYHVNKKAANKLAIPVTLVCHTASADLTALSIANSYDSDFDFMKKLSAVQGGLVSLKDVNLYLRQLKKSKNIYPVRMSFRDTMCFAPGDNHSLAALGETIKIPKLYVPDDYKNHMNKYLRDYLVEFCDYAINDSVITLLYASELWGYNAYMPVTISSASSRAAIPVINESLGLKHDDKEGFNRFFRGLERKSQGLEVKELPGGDLAYIEKANLVPISHDAGLLQDMAANCYKGGYNACFRVGFYGDNQVFKGIETFDYDLENAYPTSMSLITDIDWSNPIVREYRDVMLDSTMIKSPYEPIFAYVTFESTPGTKFPCIPVSVDGCLIYPESSGNLDGVYVSAPELWLALKINMRVHVKRMYVGKPMKDPVTGKELRALFNVVKQFVNDRNLAKEMFGSKSFQDLVMKVALNGGIYGKLAQDIIKKMTWNAETEEMINIGGSAMTSPVHACLTTSGVRAVLLATINQVEEHGYHVYSVTTDGFISNIPFDKLKELDLYGFTKIYKKVRKELTDSDNMWSMKHSQNDLCNLTTRGNVSLLPGGVMAHNSYSSKYESDSYEDRLEFFVNAIVRDSKVKSTNVSFELFKNLACEIGREDFATKMQERYLSMDFDLKRKPIQDTIIDIEVIIKNKDHEVFGVIANFDTKPYETPEEFQKFKAIGRNEKVLRTKEHWELFFAKVNTKKQGTRNKINDLPWSALMSCIIVYRQNILLPEFDNEPVVIPFLESHVTVEQKVDWINKFNKSKKHKFTKNNWKDCRKPERMKQVVDTNLYKGLLVKMMNS